MLLDPFEKQFHLPAALVERADCRRRQREIVRQKYQGLVGLRVFEAYPPQLFRVLLLGVKPIESNRLIADDSLTSIDFGGIHPMRIEIRFGAGNKKRARLMQAMQTQEIDISPIHDVDGTRLGDQNIECARIVHLAIGDVNETGNAATQIQQRMHLHRRFGRSKMRPWKHRQAQIDGGRVQCVHGIGEIQTQVLADVKRPGLSDQAMGEFGVDVPVAQFVGVGQRRSGYRASDTHMVKLGGLCREASFDIAQTLAIGELGEGQNTEMLCARQRPDTMIAAMSRHDTMKSLPWKEVHNLGEQRFANVHRTLQQQESWQSARKLVCRSSRRHYKNLCLQHQIRVPESWDRF